MTIARLAGVALDARTLRSEDPRERALAARWIAANLLAARGVRIGELRGIAPALPRVFGVHAKSLTAVLAAIAAVPALLAPTTLPLPWRLALAAVGMPIADRPVPWLLEHGASVAILQPDNSNACAVTVDTDYRVAVDPNHLLVA